MTLNANIIQNYGNGNVLVEIGSRSGSPKYYRVHENSADEFQREYIKNSKKLQWTSTGLLTVAVILFILPMTKLTKNLEKKTKMILGVLSGVAGGIGSMVISDKLEKDSYSKLLQKYNTKEINYKK